MATQKTIAQLATEASIAAALANSAALADQMQNPESALNGATVEVVEGVLGGGVQGLQRFVDAREDLATPRPVWAGQIVWYINEGDPDPLHLGDGDAVWEVEVEEVPWTPAQLGDKIVWLDAQTLGLADGTAVASWTDISGNGNHAVQATPAARPIFDIDKINGHPAVVADGIDDMLTIALTEAYAGGAFTLYMFAGTDLADNAAGSDFLLAGTATGLVNAAMNLYRTTAEEFVMRRNQTLTTAAGTWTPGSKKIRLMFNGLTSSIRVNGVTMATGQTGVTGANLEALSLFANYNATNFGPFWLGELLLVRGVVSDELDAKIVTYFEKWNA